MSCKIETIKSSLDELLVETLKSLGSNMKSKANIEKAVGIISNVAGSPVVNSWASGVLNGLADKDVISGMKSVAKDIELNEFTKTRNKDVDSTGDVSRYQSRIVDSNDTADVNDNSIWSQRVSYKQAPLINRGSIKYTELNNFGNPFLSFEPKYKIKDYQSVVLGESEASMAYYDWLKDGTLPDGYSGNKIALDAKRKWILDNLKAVNDSDKIMYSGTAKNNVISHATMLVKLADEIHGEDTKQMRTTDGQTVFDEELNKKIEAILRELYPEIKLEYTEQEILHGEGLMNQEVVSNTVKFSLKVVEALNDWATAKLSKHGGTSQPVLSTIRTKQEAGVRKRLAGKGVSKEQIDFVFEYMSQHDISEIGTKELAERVLLGLATGVEVNTAKKAESLVDYNEEENTYEPVESKDFTDEDSDYYFDLTVPGGTNYKEIEISTPSIVAPKKGHADFATDKGIGWYRVDDAKDGSLRVLEMQSDMFQKMKEDNLAEKDGPGMVLDLFKLDGFVYRHNFTRNLSTGEKTVTGYLKNSKGRERVEISKKEYDVAFLEKHGETYEDMSATGLDLDKAMHQMLNTDNKWVKFFVQSIVQNSQKNGYKKIRFPSGETAAKVEGHDSIADRIKAMDNSILGKKAEIAKLAASNMGADEKRAKESYDKALKDLKKRKEEMLRQDNDDSAEIEEGYQREVFSAESDYEIESPAMYMKGLKKDLAGLEKTRAELKTQGIEKLAPIEGFYQVRVHNTLVKTYGKENVKVVTDGHGNGWFELELNSQRDGNVIMLQTTGTTRFKDGDEINLFSQIDVDGKHVTLNFNPEGENSDGPNMPDTIKEGSEVKVVKYGEYSDDKMTYDVVYIESDGKKYYEQEDGRPYHITRSINSEAGIKPFMTGLDAKDRKWDRSKKIDSWTGVASYGKGKYSAKFDKSLQVNQTGQTGEIKGQADIEAKTVLINSLLQSQDTLPHEYAHHYIAWFRDTKIVQEAIKKWGSEEALVQAIGEQVVTQKGEAFNWWKKFTEWVQAKFDSYYKGLSEAKKEDLQELLTDAFLTRKDLSSMEAKYNASAKQTRTTDGAVNVWSTKDGVNEHRLSNMIAGPINVNGRVFATIENLFQYSKAKFAGDEKSAAEILAANNGFEAKKLGAKVTNLNKKEWDKVARQKLKQSMKLYYKQNKDGRDLLLSTAGKDITHNSQYKDDRWTKEFPELLVEIRNELSGSQKVETGTGRVEAGSENSSKSFADKIKIANKGLAADKHTWKEVVKANLSTQYIGFGKKGSSTDRYVSVYGDKANTGKYTADDVIYVSSNGARGGRVEPVVDGKLSNGYELIDKAIEAGSTIVMDSEEHIKSTGRYNVGEVALAEYMESHGYSRRNIKGAGIWTKDVVNKKPVVKSQNDSKPEEGGKFELGEASIIDGAERQYFDKDKDGKNVWLSKDQYGAADKMITMLSNNEPMFVLEGEGGTGKSHVIGAVLNKYLSKGVLVEVVAGATAHKAKDVISDFIDSATQDGFKVQRIVSLQAVGSVAVAKKGDNSYRSSPSKIIIIDEMSMISNGIMSELINKVKESNGRTKLIILGDRAQIRAVETKAELSGDVIELSSNVVYSVEDDAGMSLGKLEPLSEAKIVSYTTSEYGRSGQFREEYTHMFVPNDPSKNHLNVEVRFVNGGIMLNNRDNQTKAKIFKLIGNEANTNTHQLREQMRAKDNIEMYNLVKTARTGDGVVDGVDYGSIEDSYDAENSKVYQDRVSGFKQSVYDSSEIESMTGKGKLDVAAVKEIENGTGVMLVASNKKKDSINNMFTKFFAKKSEYKESLDNVAMYGVFVGQSLVAQRNSIQKNNEDKFTNNKVGKIISVEKMKSTDELTKSSIYSDSVLYRAGLNLIDMDDAKPIHIGMTLETAIMPKDLLDVLATTSVEFDNTVYGDNISKQLVITDSVISELESGRYDVRSVQELYEKYGKVVVDYAVGHEKRVVSSSIKHLNVKLRASDMKDIGDMARLSTPPYAQTVHKSQGSTYSTVVLDTSFLDNKNMSAVNRLELAYTGFGRASNRAISVTGFNGVTSVVANTTSEIYTSGSEFANMNDDSYQEQSNFDTISDEQINSMINNIDLSQFEKC